MLVRDEEPAVIERCLRSVGQFIDYWVICDTGTGDTRAEIITDLLKDVPGELHRREWFDFGHNRSELMDLARDKADYLLLLDADMTLVHRGPLPELVEDAYLVRDVGVPDSRTPRVVSGSREWWYEGSTYEVLATNGRFSEAVLDALAIERHTDGESRRLRLLADLGILKRDVASSRSSPRTAFYLAQTLRDLERPEAAIEWYRRRVELGGAEQEVFYANLQEGVLRAASDFFSAVPILLEAFQRRPTRAEPLYELARGYRERGDASLAYLFANQGLAIPLPTDTVFVQRWVYEWALRFERGLAAGQLGRVEEAGQDLRAVLATEGVPREFVVLVRDGLLDLAARGRKAAGPSHHHAPTALGSLVPELLTGRMDLDVRPAWPSFNPSIAADGDGFKMAVRTANYRIGHAHDDGIVRNLNYLVTLDATLGVCAVDRIDDAVDGLRRYPSQTLGFEDARLVQLDGRWFASATTCELNPIGRGEIALLELEGAKVTSVHPLAGPNPGRYEKNWMPFVHDGELHFVYTCGPMVVLRRDHRSGRLELAAESESPEPASAFRGSSQGLALGDGGYLFVIHEMDASTGRAVYTHRFISIGPDLALSALSRPFTFTGERVEFCGGAAIRESELVLSFGVSDAASYLAVLPLGAAVDLLEPVRAS